MWIKNTAIRRTVLITLMPLYFVLVVFCQQNVLDALADNTDDFKDICKRAWRKQ